MASAVEPEYESDPEELKRSLAARRREASDDDDDDDDDDGDGGEVRYRRDEIDSDQSDEQVGTVEYDNDENKSEDEEEEGDAYIADDEKRSNMMMKEAEDDDAAGHVDGDEEKEKQSSTVPTGGAFYMHDDRFQEMSAGRSRRMRGGRRSWGSGDERKWGHDKFEEINTQEKHYDKRTSRGRFRGRGRGRGQGRGYTRGSSSNASTSNGQQIFVPKVVTREGGPNKNEIPLNKGNQAHSVQRKQSRYSHGSQNPHEKTSHLNSHRSPNVPAKTGIEGAHTKKSVIASSLSSASPPFYPSVSTSDVSHGVQVGMERLHTHENAAPSGKKYRNTKSVFPPVYTGQTFQSAGQGRGAPATGNMFYRQSYSQADRSSSPMQLTGDSKGTEQSSSRPSGQGLDHHSAVNRSLSSTTQKTSSSRNQYPPGEIESPSETGASCDNSNFPAFLPVMQFGGQHGGVPTFGMAFPGYVQSENGVRNPEMTWMPVLTGPGALGASYSPPYAAIDSSYQAHKPGLPSLAGSSRKENSLNNLINLGKPMERPEVTASWVPKEQKNNPSKQPRRYSEMSFSK